MKRSVTFAFAAGALAMVASAQGPLTTTFTYQGELRTSSNAASGLHDFRFRLYDAPAGGAQLGTTLCSNNVTLAAGRFTVDLDFGPQFVGQQRFLEIEVRPDTGLDCSNAAGFTILGPRQPLTAAPSAAYALNAAQLAGQSGSYYTNAANLTGALPSGSLAGSYSGSVMFSNATNSFSGSGTGLTSLNAGNLSAGTVADARLSSNIPRLNTANAFGNATNTFGGLVGIGTLSPVSGMHIVRNWDGEEGALRLEGDRAALRLSGGAPSGNQSWMLHVGTDGPGSLGFYRRTAPTTWLPIMSLTTQGTVGIGVLATNSRPLWTRAGIIYPARFESTHSLATAVEIGNTAANAVWEYSIAGTGIPFGLAAGSTYLFKQGNTAPSLAIDPGDGGDLRAFRVRGGDLGSVLVGVSGLGTTYGVFGISGSSGYGVYCSQHFGATGTKSFRIDHPADPTNKFLLHYCSEGPEPQNTYNGTVVLDPEGRARVTLPDYFAAINKDPRYTLTAVGAPMPMLHIAQEIDESALAAGAEVEPAEPIPSCWFTIAGGAPGAKVCWRIDAVRNDRLLQRDGSPVETPKSERDRGTYQHPELYGAPPDMLPPDHPNRPRAAMTPTPSLPG